MSNAIESFREKAEKLGLCVYPNSPDAAQGTVCAIVKDRAGKDYLVTITTFPAAMVDLTNPAA